MQGCIGRNAIEDSLITRAYRELKEINHSRFKELRNYESSGRRDEAEARWMEPQTPDTIYGCLGKAAETISNNFRIASIAQTHVSSAYQRLDQRSIVQPLAIE